MNQFENLITDDSFHWDQLQNHLQEQQPPYPQPLILNLQRLAVGSSYAIQQLARYPEIISSLNELNSFDLESERLHALLQDAVEINDIRKTLRQFRHRKLCHIIYLDICQNQSVYQTLKQLSDLADLLIQSAQLKAETILSAKHGQPINESGEPLHLNVIGMGKLGGGELNFSSDIDLICCFAEDGQLSGFGQLSHSQYFTHVVKLFKQLLNDTTEDGFVYRVDLRLRPWGDSGPIVLSHTAFEHYYQLHGREWEQYAMVKARVITGSDSDISSLSEIIRPFVYRRYHDYRVFDGLAQLKHKIDRQAKRKGVKNNVKIGSGGIREIEFFIQAFQILKGGRNYQLQTPSIYRAMQIIGEQEITDPQTLDQLRKDYDFLRLLENRIQMLNDQQTHETPSQDSLKQRLCVTMNYQDWDELELQLQQTQQRVHQQFATLFETDEESSRPDGSKIILDELNESDHLSWITQMDFKAPEAVHQRLQAFYQSRALLYMSDKAKSRFREFFPEVLALVASYTDQFGLLEKLLGLMTSIAGRSVYFELLYQNIPLLKKVVDLFDSSQFIADEVSRYPLLLESILYPGHIDDRFDIDQLRHELNVQLNNVTGDIEMELDVLRQFKRAQTIAIATAEIADEISTEQVSRYLCELAQIILQAVYELSLKELTDQHGEASCVVDGQTITPVLGIIAYGKLGGYELHYQSDLDIIFLHNSSGQQQITGGEKSIDNSVFFARLGQKIISKITMLTAAGKLYEIDTRLRPDGASGMLVPPMASFEKYQQEKAWVWEHQAIIRARYIAGGDQGIAQQFDHIRHQIICQPRDSDSLKQEVANMRLKMQQAKTPPQDQRFNLKHSSGGMVDIEFLVQYWVLNYANKFASLCQSTDNIGLLGELHHLQLISDNELALQQSYLAYHRFLHQRVLQNQSDDIPSELVSLDIDRVRTCWNTLFGNDDSEH